MSSESTEGHSLPGCVTHLGRIGEVDLQRAKVATGSEVKIGFVTGHADANSVCPWKVSQVGDGLLEDFGLENAAENFRGGAEGCGKCSQVQGIFPFFQSVNFAGSEYTLLFQGQAQDGACRLWCMCEGRS